MQSLLPKILVAVLVIVAVSLGFMIYRSTDDGLDDDQVRSSSTPQPNGQQPRGSAGPTPSGLTAEERSLLSVPGKDSTQEQRRNHFLLAQKLAVSTNTLDVGDCNPDPFVIKIKEGATFTLENSGKEARTMDFDQSGKTFRVEPGKTAAVKLSFKNGSGLYGYGCDNPSLRSGGIGFILVEPAN